jgi:serine/threonine protein kinase
VTGRILQRFVPDETPRRIYNEQEFIQAGPSAIPDAIAMTPELPKRIDRYEIVERLGRGGMGVVYLATDPALGRTVAIKMLTEDNEELRERFAREARSAAALKHNNIVTIYDVGEDQGRPFIAMEYLEGENLAEVIRRRAQVPLRQKIDWILELCAGLGYAHRTHIVHRDIKPANLLITTEGSLKILDFGIARVTADATADGLTRMGMLMGSPHYMSPEQAEGQPVDERSDIFAVGLVMYELLSSERAFPGDTPHVVLNNIMNREPRPILEFCPDMDPELVRIVTRGLVKDRNGRYQTLAAMAADLHKFRERVPEAGSGTAMVDSGATLIARPAAASQTPTPGMLDSNALARRRAAEISRHLDEASASFRAGEYEAAIEYSEKVLVINPQEARAIEILQLTYRAMEARQVRQWLGEAEALKTEGALTGAERLVTQALQMQPDSLEAQTSLLDIRERRRQRDRGGEDPTLLADGSRTQSATGTRTFVSPSHTGASSQTGGPSPVVTHAPLMAPPTVAAAPAAVAPQPNIRQGDSRKLALILLATAVVAGGAGAVVWWMNRDATGAVVGQQTAQQTEAPPVATSSPVPTSIPAATPSPTPPIVPEQTPVATPLPEARGASPRQEQPVRSEPLVAATPTSTPKPPPRTEAPPPENRRDVEIRDRERQLKQALTARDTAAARGHLDAIRRLDRSYAGLVSLETALREAEAADARAREAAAADRNAKEAAGLLQKSRGLTHADAIPLLKQAVALDAANREISRELTRRESEAAAEASKRSPAAETAARSAVRQVLSQFVQVFNGDNGRKAEGFRKLWPSMTAGDLAALNALDTATAARDWTGPVDAAEIRFDNNLTSATVTWTVTLRGRDRGSNVISYEERTATFALTGGTAWVITRVIIAR